MSSPLTLATTGSPAGAAEAGADAGALAAKAGTVSTPRSKAAVVSRILFDIEVPWLKTIKMESRGTLYDRETFLDNGRADQVQMILFEPDLL